MKIHKPLSFEQRSFREIPLGDAPSTASNHAQLALQDRRAFFLTGAGSSAGPPTGLPTGPQLAAELVRWARAAGFGESIDPIEDKSDLGEVCKALERDIGRGDVVRHIREAFDWEDSEFNLCHLVVALLYGEEVLEVSFTVNWDPKLGDAIRIVAGPNKPRVVRNKQTMSEVGNNPCLVHIHGHWSDPESLVMTTAELDRPSALKWTDPNLRAALTAKDPIFVGFAAEADYVIHSLHEMREEMERAPASVIGLNAVADFRSNSTRLADALRLGENEDRYVQGDASEVMGELLRCCYREMIDAVLTDAEARARVGESTQQVVSTTGAEQVRRAVEALSVEGLLGLLWAATAKVSPNGSSEQATLSVLSAHLAESLAVVMVLASCTDATGLSVSLGGFRLNRVDGTSVDLWPAIPTEHLNPSEAQARAYQHGDRFSGPADAGVPLVLICAGTSGALPRSSKVSLVGAAPPANVRSGSRVPADVVNLNELDRRFEGVGHTGTLAQGLNL